MYEGARRTQVPFVQVVLMERRETVEEIQVGQPAPDFELASVTGEEKGTFKLSSLRGQKNAVLVFYPLDFTPV